MVVALGGEVEWALCTGARRATCAQRQNSSPAVNEGEGGESMEHFAQSKHAQGDGRKGHGGEGGPCMLERERESGEEGVGPPALERRVALPSGHASGLVWSVSLWGRPSAPSSLFSHTSLFTCTLSSRGCCRRRSACVLVRMGAKSKFAPWVPFRRHTHRHAAGNGFSFFLRPMTTASRKRF